MLAKKIFFYYSEGVRRLYVNINDDPLRRSLKMAEKVLKVGMDREDGFLYYIDKDGDIARVQMARGGKKGGKPKKVEKCGIKKEKGYLYFLDKKGDISRAKMVNAK